VKRDSTLAATWFKKAADQDHTEAQANLGLCYEDGDGVERNLEQALLYPNIDVYNFVRGLIILY
jgi:TPR repeat protein